MELARFLKRVDVFRRIDDSYLASATLHGGTLTVVAYVLMVALAIMEFSSYLTTKTSTSVVMDVNQDESLMLHFNITMLDIPCKFTAVDVYDAFGWERQNVTYNILKTRIHVINGNLVDGDSHDSDDDSIEHEDDAKQNMRRPIELDDEGHHALDLVGSKGFEEELKTHDYTFMNFYAPWCSHCRALAPTWEKAAAQFDEIDFRHRNVKAKFSSINCEKYQDVCQKYRIRAFPSLLLFNREKPLYPFYDGDRLVEDLVEALEDAVLDYERHLPNTFHDQGCRVSGWLEVPRVPGNFHIEARSVNHDLSPSMSNLSHVVNHLQFGDTLNPRLEQKLPQKHRFLMHPIDDRKFLLDKAHTAPQHYIKVVSTMYEFDETTLIPAYQMTTQNRIATYDEDEIPEAKFSYDMAPVSVIVSQKGKPLYQFLTSLFAIIGGTFTVISVFDGAVETVNVKIKRSLGKMS